MSHYLPWLTVALVSLSFTAHSQASDFPTPMEQDYADIDAVLELNENLVNQNESFLQLAASNVYMNRTHTGKTYSTRSTHRHTAGHASGAKDHSSHAYSTHQSHGYSGYQVNKHRYYRYPYQSNVNYGSEHYYHGYPSHQYATGYRYRMSPYSVYNAPYHYRHRDYYYPGYYGVVNEFNYSRDSDVRTTQWEWGSFGRNPHGAVYGGRVHGQKYYVCQAGYHKNYYLGKLYNKGCHLDINGKTVVMNKYKVLVER